MTEATVHRGERLIDRCRLEIIVFAQVHRSQQPGIIGGLVSVPALVAHPVIVDLRVGSRLEPPEPPLVLLGTDVAAGRAAGANRVVLGEEPDALTVQEVLIEQRSDGTDVDNVARQRVGVQRVAGEDGNLGMIAPAHHFELAGLGDLAGEADTPRAHDTAVLIELDQVRHILGGLTGRSSTKR